MCEIKEINIYLLKEKANEDEEPSIMIESYNLCKINGLETKWISYNECKHSEFNNKSIIIMHKLESDFCDNLQKNTSARIMGPRCLNECLIESVIMPNLSWPIYNLAMNGMLVTCSGLSQDDKNKIKTKVHLMAGLYYNKLLETTMYLVTDSVNTDKYRIAVQNGVKIMDPEWIDAIWKDSQDANVKANSEKYNKYNVKVFHKLVITSTGFANKVERNDLINDIKEHGGHYTGCLNLSKTNVLVCQDDTTSDKYKAALKSGRILCVNKNWIIESILKGYPLPEENFRLKRKTSTPTKEVDLPNFSMISEIMPSTSRAADNTYNETLNMSSTTAIRKRKRNDSEESTYFNCIDIYKAKSAGTFLDGCNIYSIGFDAEDRDKLHKILDFSGATRYDEINNRLTHCIVGNRNCQELKTIVDKSLLQCPIVNVKWLSDSIKQKQPVPETEYLVKMNDIVTIDVQNSPLSQKGLSLLRKSVVQSEIRRTKLKFDDTRNDLLNEYLNSNTTAREVSSNSTLCVIQEQDPKITETNLSFTMSESLKCNDYAVAIEQNVYSGLKFKIVGIEPAVEIKRMIESMSGKVINAICESIKTDYIVLPTFIEEPYETSSIETVTNKWVDMCYSFEKLIEVDYYYKPIVVKRTKPLSGCVITITNYFQCERSVLQLLIVELGAILQDELSRKEIKDKNILPNTHLISPSTDGKKYEFALRWKLSIVTKDWLLECARLGQMVPLDSYFVNENSRFESVQQRQSTHQKLKTVTNEMPQSDRIEDDTEIERNVNVQEQQKSKDASSSNSTSTDRPIAASKFSDLSTSFSTPKGPIRKLLQEWGNVKTPEVIETPKRIGYLGDMPTPKTPLGSFLGGNPSPNLRKACAVMLNKYPGFIQTERRCLSTPLSELKRKCWERLLSAKPTQLNYDSDHENEPPQNIITNQNDSEEMSNEGTETVGTEPSDTQDNVFDQKLEQLKSKMTSSSTKKKSFRKSISNTTTVTTTTSTATCTGNNIQDNDHMLKSQPMTVGWDFANTEDIVSCELPPKQITRTFMLTGITNEEQKQLLTGQIESLGGVVSALSMYDPSATHIVCPQLSRNEKIFSCMAAGKWILHIKYIEASVDNNGFVDEEQYEFGNPKFVIKSNALDNTTEARYKAVHYWRKEIGTRGYGAFHGIRGIVVATNRNGIVSVIKSGDGIVLDAMPPFGDNILSATHCFIEQKTVQNIKEYVPLAEQGIYCVSTLYISEFLHLTKKSIKDCILPMFQKYYNDNNGEKSRV